MEVMILIFGLEGVLEAATATANEWFYGDRTSQCLMTSMKNDAKSECTWFRRICNCLVRYWFQTCEASTSKIVLFW